MSTVARKRLLSDLKKIQNQPPDGVKAAPHDDDLFIWDVYISGPPATPWEGGVFKLCMEFADDFPMKPPKVWFVSKVFHPNVLDTGVICLDVLYRNWTPVYDATCILRCIQALLTDPNPDGFNVEACRLYMGNRTEYDRRVRECAKQSVELNTELDPLDKLDTLK